MSVKTEWDGAIVQAWLARRVVAARADQAAAQRAGHGHQDDCDKATAEETVCALLKGRGSTATQQAFAEELRALLDRDDHAGRGVYDDDRFDRHVRTYLRKLIRMTKANEGFDRTMRYQ